MFLSPIITYSSKYIRIVLKVVTHLEGILRHLYDKVVYIHNLNFINNCITIKYNRKNINLYIMIVYIVSKSPHLKLASQYIYKTVQKAKS